MRDVKALKPVTREEAAALLEPFRKAGRFVLAVSGGPDSVAMMGLVSEVRDAIGWPDAVVATIDHGLRPESAEEAKRVAPLAERLGFAHSVLTWLGEKPRTGIQEEARHARYRLLLRHAQETNSDGLMIAHTLDDQAETILMRFLHGSGLAGLGGIGALVNSEGVVCARPLLGISKARLVATCEHRDWPFVRDPSNEDARFLRARLRKLMPLLAEEGLTAERLAKFGQRAEGADEALQAMAADCLLESEEMAFRNRSERGVFDGAVFARAPFETAVRMVAELIRRRTNDAFGGDRLQKLENLTRRLQSAIRDGKSFDATLSDVKISCRQGVVRTSLAPPRSLGLAKGKDLPLSGLAFTHRAPRLGTDPGRDADDSASGTPAGSFS